MPWGLLRILGLDLGEAESLFALGEAFGEEAPFEPADLPLLEGLAAVAFAMAKRLNVLGDENSSSPDLDLRRRSGVLGSAFTGSSGAASFFSTFTFGHSLRKRGRSKDCASIPESAMISSMDAMERPYPTDVFHLCLSLAGGLLLLLLLS